MKTIIKAGILAVLALAYTGCATVKLKRPEVDNVKKIAIIGYTGAIDMSDASDQGTATGFGAITNAIKGEAAVAETVTRRVDQANKVYELLTKSITEATGWALLDRAAIEANPEYQKLVAANPSDAMVTRAQVLPAIVRAEAVDKMDPAARAELIKALGVDAVAFVHMKVICGQISGVSFGGMGRTEKHPKAIIELKLMDAATPEPLWSERRAEGKVAENGLARTMGIDSDENETPAFMEAAQTAVATLTAHYKEAKALPIEGAAAKPAEGEPAKTEPAKAEPAATETAPAK